MIQQSGPRRVAGELFYFSRHSETPPTPPARCFVNLGWNDRTGTRGASLSGFNLLSDCGGLSWSCTFPPHSCRSGGGLFTTANGCQVAAVLLHSCPMTDPKEITDWISDAVSGLEPLATVAEVAAVLRQSRKNVYRVIASGDLHALRPHGGKGGSRYLIPRASLEAYLRAMRAPSPHVWA